MTENNVLKLKHPISDGKTEWDELEWPTRFKLKHMRAFPKGFMKASTDYAAAVKEEQTKAEAANREPKEIPVPEELNLTLWEMAPIVAQLTNVPEEVIGELDEDDWEAVSGAIMGFFDSRQQETGEKVLGS